MFVWYKNSDTCYVYLADVEDPDNVAGNLADKTEIHEWTGTFHARNPVEYIKKARFKDSLRKSKWFTRGWTLQELLAPSCILLFTKEWKPISVDFQGHSNRYSMSPWGSKYNLFQEPLLSMLADITGIRLDVLTFSDDIMSCSIGERMSWMAGRETTREEDASYCLLGIFDINMPLLYGEGSKAFIRLQEEIVKQSTDHSLFAWQCSQEYGNRKTRQPNLFAPSSKLFLNLNKKLSGSRTKLYSGEIEENINPLTSIVSLTNFGLSINLELIPTANPDYLFGVLSIVTNGFRNPQVLPDRELCCLPLLKKGSVYYRERFPPGPILLRTRRKRSIHLIHIPRGDVKLLDYSDYTRQYAFIIIFPDLLVGEGLTVTSITQIGGAVLNAQRSTVFIQNDALQDGNIAAAILSLERNGICSFLLRIGARQAGDAVETTVKLFSTETSLETMENTPMTFRPAYFYCDECCPYSLVVSKGQIIEPLPPKPKEFRQSSPVTIFTVSLFIDGNVAGLASEEEVIGFEGAEASDLKSMETTDSESEEISNFEVEDTMDVEYVETTESNSDTELSDVYN